MKLLMSAMFGLLVLVSQVHSAELPSEVTLFKNIKVFNGTDDALYDVDVLVVGNKVHKVEKDIPVSGTYELDVKSGVSREIKVGSPVDFNSYSITVIDESGTTEKKEVSVNVIDGGGRTLMPGLIDMHTHTGLKRGVPDVESMWDGQAVGAMAHETMMQYLHMGYTTLRDICAGSLGVARAENAGVLTGPRMYSGGACIGATSGHSDWAVVTNDGQSNHERIGNVVVADGPQAVADAARRNFRGGATVLKVFVGGGVASQYDPLEAVTYTQQEIAAAVQIANDFKSYVCIHAYSSEAIDMALDAGVRCVEHGFLVNEETIKRMKKDGIVLSAQAFMSYTSFANPAGIPGFTAESQRKALQVHEGADQMFKWAAKHELEMFAGSDMFTYDLIPQATKNLTDLERWFTPVQVLRMATSNAGKWLMKTGPKNPYKEAQLGTLVEGSYADLILVDGNPLEGVGVLLDFENNIDFVMKDGVVYRNEL